ncbi:MAG: hypothetical protein J7575_11280 [Chloroflexi bacterium]|nr:hypothetical protein [Chloroflexota bacterium]
MSTLRTWLADRWRRGKVRRVALLPPLAPSPAAIERVVAWLSRFRLLRPLMEGVLPVPRLLRDETVQLEIRMAPYRLQAARTLFTIVLALLLLSLVGAAVISLLPISGFLRAGVWLFTLLPLLGFFKTVHQILLYYQWRFMLTNKRIIIIAPDPRRSGFADAVYLKGGRIQVVDTAWSSSALWGLFQAMTGARDVILSLAGYEFKPEGAEVKGGLRFPDVMPEDIAKLEEIIFG